MRRYFSGSGFSSALRHEVRSSKSAAPKSSNVVESTKGLLKEKKLEMENMSICKRSFATASDSMISSLVEIADAAKVSATSAAKSAVLAMTALRREIAREVALAEHDQLYPDLALSEKATADADNKISLLKSLPISKRSVATGANPTIASFVEAALVAQISAASAAKSTALAMASVRQQYAREVALSRNDKKSSDLAEEATTDEDKKISLQKSLLICNGSVAAHPFIPRLVEDAYLGQVSAASAAKSAGSAMATLREEVVREVALAGHYEQFPYVAFLACDIADEDKKISLQKCLRSLAANPTFESLVEAAYLEQISAATATKSAALTISTLRNEVARIALDGHDQLPPDPALLEEVGADEDKKITLQKILKGLEMRCKYMKLKKDPDCREKLSRALPSVEIESDLIASLLIKEPLIIFLAAPCCGEKGQVTEISPHGLFYTNNKGVPLRAVMGIRKAEPYALESSIFDAELKFPSVKFRIFAARKSLVKSVQERMRRLKAGERIRNDIYTKIAQALIEKGSTIEFIAGKDNIAGFLADLAAKIGIELLEVDLPYQLDSNVLNALP